MARNARFSFKIDGITDGSIGGLVKKATRKMSGVILDGANQNMKIIMDLIGDIWIDVAQSAVRHSWSVPAHRSTLIVDRDISRRSVTFGWEDFKGDAKTRFSRLEPLMRNALDIVLDEVPTGVLDEGFVKRAAARARLRNMIATSIGASDSEYTKSSDAGVYGGKFKTRKRLRPGRRR